MGPPFPAFLQGHGASPRSGTTGSASLVAATARVAVARRPMSYRELTMIDVREVLRRWAAKQSTRKIARETGADRKTVARYTAAARDAGLAPDEVLTDEVVHEIAQRVQARPLVEASDERREVAGHKARIE